MQSRHLFNQSLSSNQAITTERPPIAFFAFASGYYTPLTRSSRLFLAAGPPPVYFGFGSMLPPGKSRKTGLSPLDYILQALERLPGVRALLAIPEAHERTDLPGNTIALRAAPHAWLFPRLSAVVHHGGAGTTAAGLHAGAPSIIVPFMGEQAFWAQRVAELGVGLQAPPLACLSPNELARALQTILNDDLLQSRARALSERLLQKDGLGQAIELIEKTLSTRTIGAGQGIIPTKGLPHAHP